NDAAYILRASLRYNQQTWKDALSDFRKLVELNPSYDYARFGVWLAQARLGERDAASKELQAYLTTRPGKPTDWPARVGGFLAGQITESEFFKVTSPDKTIDDQLHCEAYFYAGTMRLLQGDKATAKEYFEKCIATNMKTFAE